MARTPDMPQMCAAQGSKFALLALMPASGQHTTDGSD